jgi:hypothetical protein
MIDAGIKFEERLYARDATWPETKEKLKKQGLTRTGQLPSVEYKGKVLTGVSRHLYFSLSWHKLTKAG